MESRVASEILASALRDMDELIRANESTNTGVANGGPYSMHPNGFTNGSTGFGHSTAIPLASGDHRYLVSNNHTAPTSKQGLRASSSEVHIQELLYELDYSVENLKSFEGRSFFLPTNTRRFLQSFLQDKQDQPATRDASCNTMKVHHIEVVNQPSVSSNPPQQSSPSSPVTASPTSMDDTLKSRVILLQNQVDAQAKRIAELEQKREKPLNSLLSNMESLDKLDLLTEVSKQQVQIASLEQAKIALESQLHLLQERLTDLSLGPEKSTASLTGSVTQANGNGALVSIQRRLDMIPPTPPAPPPAPISTDEGERLNEPIGEARFQPPVPAHSRTACLGSNNHSPLDLSTKPAMDLTRNHTTRTEYDLHIPHNQLPTATSNFAYPSSGGILNSSHYKSISLNELHQPRLNIINPYSGTTLPSTRNYLDQFRVTQRGISPNESLSSPIYASPPPIDVNQLPPQYPNDHHRQTYMNNRTPPLIKPEPSRIQEQQPTLFMRRSPQPDQQLCSPVDGLPPPGVHVDKMPPYHSPMMRRARTPKQGQDRFVRPATPPVSRRATLQKPSSSLLDRSGYEYHPDGPSMSRPKSTTRLRRLFTDNPFRWFSQRRNSTCETSPKASSISVPPRTANTRSSLSAAYAYGRSSSLRVPHNAAFHKVDSSNSLWTTRDSRKSNGRASICDSSHWNYNKAYTGGDQYTARQSVPNMPSSLSQQPWVNGIGAASLPSSSSTIETPSDASQLHSLTPPIVTGLVPETGNSEDPVECSSGAGLPLRRQRIFRFAYPSRDFIHWDKDMVSAWLYELGLGYTVPGARRWLQQGADLARAPRKTIEQEMCIRNPLHLKKLLLHLQLRTKETILLSPDPPLVQMHVPTDFNVTAWLDDLGLSEYAGVFDTAAIDALVLNNLTLEDMLSLKITNELHVLSFRRGLQVLRRINFNLNRLCRDSTVEHEVAWRETEKRSSNPDSIELLNNGSTEHLVNNNTNIMSKSFTGSTQFSESPKNKRISPVLPRRSNTVTNLNISNVCYWTQYRVITWLNYIELPEYARNLDGTGVHGALIMLEDRFNPDLLANILRIPSNKTLVRRHLTSKFVELVGNEVWERKQAVVQNPDIPTLTLHSRIKPSRKRAFFLSHRKRKGSEYEEELLCPLDNDWPLTNVLNQESTYSERASSETTSMQHLELRETDL